MKTLRFPLFSALSLGFACVMLFFTFFQWGWFSDSRGMDAYFEIPIGTKDGSLSTFADMLWMSAPFFLLGSVLLSFLLPKKEMTPALTFFAVFPEAFYAVLQLILYASGKEAHFSLIVTQVFLIVICILGLFAGKSLGLRSFLGQFCLIHVGVETVLLILSMLLEEKLSQFYFSELLPMGMFSNFRYRFFVISVFLYYVSYSLSLGFRFLCGSPPEKNNEPPRPPQIPKEPDVDEDAEAYSLTLEDFGIEK